MESAVKGKTVALVTGASSGIGYEYARQLAERRYNLLLVSNEEEPIQKVARELSIHYSVSVEGLYRDLSHLDAASSLYCYCRENDIVVEILINNAGIFFFNDVINVNTGKLSVIVNLHVYTVSMLCHFFGEDMAKRGKGYILNMSSLAAKIPYPGISVYAATKSYVRTLSKAMYNEMYDKGVIVTAVCPGGVATNLYNLKPELLRLGVRLGILMPTKKLAYRGLSAMFAGKRCITPGWINYLFSFGATCVPSVVVRMIKRKAKFYQYGK